MKNITPYNALLNYFFHNVEREILSKTNYQVWWNLGMIHAPSWKPNPSKDKEVAEYFSPFLSGMQDLSYETWKSTPRGSLAYVIISDTLPRCFYRGKVECYQFEHQALSTVREGLSKGFDLKMQPYERAIYYMPLTHSEDLSDQMRSYEFYNSLLVESKQTTYDYRPEDHDMVSLYEGFLYSAARHRTIVTHFGRFPNRNVGFGRKSTEEELLYLKNPWHFFSDENEP